MAFQVPTFNLTCNIWRGTSPEPPAAPDVVGHVCALMHAKKNAVDPTLAIVEGYLWSFSLIYLLVPALSDFRDENTGSGEDIVECPLGTGRYYYVLNVDDVAKGYPNEYRVVQLAKWSTIPWPTPIA